MAMDRSASFQLPEIRVPAKLTFAGLIAGLALGVALRGTDVEAPLLALAEPVGALWLRALQMTIVPLVVALLFTGIAGMVTAARAGAMARRTLALFALVLASGTTVAALLMPALLRLFPVPAGVVPAGSAPDGGTIPDIGDFLASLVPANVIDAAARDAMVPLIVFTALFACAATRLPDEPRRLLGTLFAGIAGAMIVIVGWVLMLAPVGVLALGFTTAARAGAAAVGALGHYILIVSAMGAIVLAAAYALAVMGARQPLAAFARAVMPAQAVALSTQSSLASLPAMLAACRALGLRDTSAEFVLPLAVAIFRATSPAMNLAVVIYAAHLSGIEPTPLAIAAGAGVALVTTIGSVSLPGTISFIASTGPIALAMGVPVAPLALLVAVEMLPDLMRTLGNVTMDVAVTATVDRRS